MFFELFDSREEYHKYCLKCGKKLSIDWKVYTYDTNTGKPKSYIGEIICRKCYYHLDTLILDEWDYLHRTDEK
jgi:ribosomal protein L40E